MRIVSMIALAVMAASTATAQGVEHVAGPRPGARGEGVRIVAPGALLWASFDRDLDGKVTDAEITAAAPAAFARADANSDGALSAFEQGAWAERIGAREDVLANPMVFDADLDRSITREEFRAGLLRLAGGLRPADADALSFQLLVRSLDARDEREAAPDDGVERIDPQPGRDR